MVFFLKSQVVVGYYVDWLSADLHQDSWESWGQIWFSSGASINKWTNWICQVDKVWAVDRARTTYDFCGGFMSQSSDFLLVWCIGGGESRRSSNGSMVTFGEEFDVAKKIPSLQSLQ